MTISLYLKYVYLPWLLMIMYSKMIAEETARSLLGKEVDDDKKRFKIVMPEGGVIWLSGSNVSEAFLSGWKQLEGKHLPLP